MMRPTLPDNPSGAALLDVARLALLDEVAPAVTDRQRYVVLMVANAIGIAIREIEGAEANAKAWNKALMPVSVAGNDDPLAALAAGIRSGAHDGDAALYEALRETAEVAAGIWKPALAAKQGVRPTR